MTAGDDDILVALLEAIADVEGVDVTDLSFSLADYINTEAVAGLSAGAAGEWRLTFVVADHTVVLESAGFVTVDGHQRVFDGHPAPGRSSVGNGSDRRLQS